MRSFQFELRTCFRGALVRSYVVFAVLLAGCGGSNPHPVKVNLAKSTLESVMESWKNGETPELVRAKKPSVIVQDMDWTSGTKLIDYEILDDEKPVDANLIARVKLKLSGAGGKEIEKTATYVVGTSPALTVFRDIMK